MTQNSGTDRENDDHGPAYAGIESGTAEAPPEFEAAREHLLVELARLVDTLRRDGVFVPATGSLDAARALSVVGLGDKRRVETALRASLLSETEDADAFEDAFAAFWHRLRSGLDRVTTTDTGPSVNDDGEAGSESRADVSAGDVDELQDADPPEIGGDGDGDVSVRIPTGQQHVSGDREAESSDSDSRLYSAVGGSQPVDTTAPQPSASERAAIDRFVDSLGTIPGRRHRRSTTGTRVDARSALRTSLETGGAPIELPTTEPIESELRCCLLVDVSGSVLDTIDRGVLLALAERLTGGARSARVFLFDTDLVEATDAFAASKGDPAAALRDAEIEWGGGTRIGHALESLRETAPHAIDRRTTVVVVSDGLDVGEPDLLSEGITWLADRSESIVWLNPLAASPEFEPESRGMATVTPYVDAVFGFAVAADLDDAATQIERLGLSGPVGYEHDRRRVDRGWS